MSKLEVYGIVNSASFQRAKEVALKLPVAAQVYEFLEADWEEKVFDLTNSYSYEEACLLDNELLGNADDLCNWAAKHYKFQEPNQDYELLAETQYREKLLNSKKRYVLWEVAIGEEKPQKMVIELDFELCPRTCENFWELAVGLGKYSYSGSLFHRIVKKGFVEGGLIFNEKDLLNTSYCGGFFPDENYAYPHAKAGIIGMSKEARNQNGSAFYITLRQLPYLDGRFVAFGRVVEGMSVLRSIAQVETNNQRPVKNCTILKSENYIRSPTPSSSRSSRPMSPQIPSKLESAELETLVKRRQAIVSEIELTREELEEQKKLRQVINKMLST